MINGKQYSKRPVLLSLSTQHNQQPHMLDNNQSSHNGLMETWKVSVEDDDLTHKIQYLNKLKAENSQMVVRIKQINKQLDSEVNHIKKKMQNKARSLKKPVDLPNKRDKATEAKYRQLQRLKKQLDKQLAIKNSIGSLQQRLKSLKSQYKQKFSHMQQVLYNLNKLKALKNHDRNQSQATTSTPQTQKVNSQNQKQLKHEIAELKGLVKAQTSRIYSDKNQFIRNNKAQRKNHSTLEIRKEGNTKKDEEDLTPEARSLKAEYIKIGKRIQILKNRKLLLMISEGKNRKKQLSQLQRKLEELRKLVNK